jgi:hypothetical protein
VDPATSLWVRAALHDSFNGAAGFAVLDAADRTAAVKNWIVRNCGRCEFVLTARVDSDDAIWYGYVETLLHESSKSKFDYYNYPVGLTYETQSGRLAHEILDPRITGPFLARLEVLTSDIRTVYETPHHTAMRQGTVANLWESPAWLQVIHGDNLSNVPGAIRVQDPYDKYLTRFSLPPKSLGE